MPRPALTFDEIISSLDVYYDAEFTFIKSEDAADLIVNQPRNIQDFILNLCQRISATNEELAFQFTLNSIKALEAMDQHMVEAWAMTATDNYDRKGLAPAMTVIRDLENYVHTAHVNACGAVLDEEISILLPFAQGLSGRKLKIAEAEDNHAYTDTETIFLPTITALLEESKDNFLIYKATVAFLWAQIQFGTFRFPFAEALNCKDPESQLLKITALESIRLEACIKRELPGLHRDMQMLKQKTIDSKETVISEDWKKIVDRLSAKNACINDTLHCLPLIEKIQFPESCCYQGILKLDAVNNVMQKRIEKEKAYFRIALSEMAKESLKKNNNDSDEEPEINTGTTFNIKKNPHDENEPQTNSGIIELELEGELVPIPDHVKELMTSIVVDFGEIPPEYLHAAGPGEYDLKKYEEEMA
jgi:nitric oxide reductase NorD protein